ncbi:MAG: ATP-binding cassette domain-containing protein, partial [Terriglobales bacterium]
RTRTATAQIDFSATDRKTKRLIELEGVSCTMGNRTLFEDLNFTLTAGMRVGLVGPNGSGKTTLLRLLQGELSPAGGEIRRADWLRIVYFDQTRTLDPDVTLRRALAPDGDSIVYRDRVIHVAGWAARFLFTGEQLSQPVGRLSGGERARVLVAQLMLQPADILLLDEPTNDLDIPTLEILEESLIDFPGSLVLVTHDRYLLDRVSSIVLGLNGNGGASTFAEYAQWEAWQAQRTSPDSTTKETSVTRASGASMKKKLSYLEAREYATIEQSVEQAEQLVRTKRADLEDPALATDAQHLVSAQSALDAAQLTLDALYARWAELEKKNG